MSTPPGHASTTNPSRESHAVIFLLLLAWKVIFQVSFHPLWLSGALFPLSLAGPGGLSLPLSVQVRHPGLSVARRQGAVWPMHEPTFAFTAWRGRADLVSSQQDTGLQDRLASLGGQAPRDDALPRGTAWEPPAGKAMGPKHLTMLMDMGWETLCPRY